jgi:hypothetical protein
MHHPLLAVSHRAFFGGGFLMRTVWMDGGIRALFEIERFHVKSWMVFGFVMMTWMVSVRN